jgi:hypothetical protein
MPKFEEITPILRVRDVAASIGSHIEKVGFATSWHWGDPPSIGLCVATFSGSDPARMGRGCPGELFTSGPTRRAASRQQ